MTTAFTAPLKSTVEVDETYIDSKEKNKHANKRTPGSQGRGSFKTKEMVVAIVQRHGKVRAFHVKDSTQTTLHRLVEQNVALGARVNIDQYIGYHGLSTFYLHKSMNHSIGEYVVGDTHTNTVEGVFAGFKRSLIGIYHQVSTKHLQRYLDESSFRYNHRDAARLSISARTVEAHVSSIIAKLDAQSRTEAVRIAAERGLIK